MFPITVTISNLAQLNAVMAALNVGGIEPPKTTSAHVAETVKEEAKATKTKPKAEEKATETTAGKKPEADTPPATPPADAPTYQATADAVTKLARTKGRDAAVAVLAHFGAAKLPDVKPEQFAAVIAACEAEV
jgi:hypothetical protein